MFFHPLFASLIPNYGDFMKIQKQGMTLSYEMEYGMGLGTSLQITLTYLFVFNSFSTSFKLY